jgi:hypothetical protein
VSENVFDKFQIKTLRKWESSPSDVSWGAGSVRQVLVDGEASPEFIEADARGTSLTDEPASDTASPSFSRSSDEPISSSCLSKEPRFSLTNFVTAFFAFTALALAFWIFSSVSSFSAFFPYA